MLDTSKVGIRICSLRKKLGLSQEKLAELLCISPQAISKWENGHTLPETSLLPVLSQIFGCTIDDIIMPAYSFDERIEAEKPTVMEQQAEYIAKHVIQSLQSKASPVKAGLSINVIADSFYKMNPNIGYCTIAKGEPVQKNGDTLISISITSPEHEFMLIEKIYGKNDAELHKLGFVSRYTSAIPRIYHIDPEKKTVLMDDLSGGFIQGYDFNENNKNGSIYRANYNAVLRAAAKLHSAFWENKSAFVQLGLDWRLETRENLLAHISCLEKDYKKYRKNEDAGKIPKVWGAFENNIESKKLDCFMDAVDYLKEEYAKLIDLRFNTGKNITIIHGDLHPGQTLMSKGDDRSIKFIGLQAVRVGICTEDLAMLLALHIEPDKAKAMPLLDYYYQCLCETVKDYPYEIFINDYKISVAENMFFTVKLINSGIYDFDMRERAIRAFKTFVLEG